MSSLFPSKNIENGKSDIRSKSGVVSLGISINGAMYLSKTKNKLTKTEGSESPVGRTFFIFF